MTIKEKETVEVYTWRGRRPYSSRKLAISEEECEEENMDENKLERDTLTAAAVSIIAQLAVHPVGQTGSYKNTGLEWAEAS